MFDVGLGFKRSGNELCESILDLQLKMTLKRFYYFTVLQKTEQNGFVLLDVSPGCEKQRQWARKPKIDIGLIGPVTAKSTA